MLRKVELICVTGTNSNKFIRIEELGDGTFKTVHGRIGSSESKPTIRPMSRWDSYYRSKVNPKKGYQDVTSLKATTVQSGFDPISDAAVADLVRKLEAYANKTVQHNYVLGVDQVTQAQIDEAQLLLDGLNNMVNGKVNMHLFNAKLIALFTALPRKMSRTQDHLIAAGASNKEAQRVIDSEQKLLNVLKTQIKTAPQSARAGQTMLDTMGLEIRPANAKELEEVKKFAGHESHRVRQVFVVVNKAASTSFDAHRKQAKNKSVRLYWHGSRNENWLSILDTSLKVRISGVVKTGSMFGQGIYFADNPTKSLGYTSLSGTHRAPGVRVNKNDKSGFMALFAVHVGERHHLDASDSSLCKAKMDRLGCDSTYAHKGTSLYNNEYIVYRDDQVSVKYIVEFA